MIIERNDELGQVIDSKKKIEIKNAEKISIQSSQSHFEEEKS